MTTGAQRGATLGVIALCLALYVPPAARTPFFTKGEPREGLVVRRMVEDGDWVLPKRTSPRGWTIASKPPFFHWIGALASWTSGTTTEWTVRLPSVAAVTAATALTWSVGASVLPAPAALSAAVVLATTFEWVRAGSTARVDGMLAALVTIGLLLLYRGFVRDGLTRAEALVVYLCFACASLTKGPVGAVLPALVLCTALAAAGRLRRLGAYHPWLGLVIVLGIVGGWYLAAWQLGGDSFVRKHVMKENVFRFLGATQLRSGHAHPVYYYLPTLAAGFLPWTPLLVPALVAAVRTVAGRRARAAAGERDPRVLFPLVWFLVVFVFYSLASAKRSVYLLLLFPAGAFLVGWWCHELATGGRVSSWVRSPVVRRAWTVAAVVVLVVGGLAIAEGVGFAVLRPIEPLLHEKDQANLPIVRALLGTHLPIVAAGLTAIAAAVFVCRAAFGDGRWYRVVAAVTVVAAALWTLVFSVIQPDLARRRSLAPFMREAAARAGGTPLYFFEPSFDYSAAFYDPARTRHWRRARPPEGGPHLVLVWDVDLAELPPEERARFEILARSDGTDPKGRRHMLLARLLPRS
jgi:4-amino-4-deoxy-L-arabinose transferase-like glycosyltransferase